MVNFLLNLLIILFVYVIVYILYYAVCVFNSTKAKKFLIKQKYNAASKPNNMILIIYARNNEATIVPLLEALNKQNYPKDNYQTHIILDHCTDNSSNILEFIGGAKIWRVGENAPVGRDEAVSWLLEGLLSYQNVDAFVFLNANRYIDENFLASINANLSGENILIGSTDYIVRTKSLLNKIKTTSHSYIDRIFNCGRSLMGLASVVDSDVFIVRKDVLDKIKCVDFKDINSELKYTTLLVRNDFIPKFCPLVKTYTSIDNFNDRKPSISFKLSLVWHCLGLIFKSNLKFGEFMFSIGILSILELKLLLFTGVVPYVNKIKEIPYLLTVLFGNILGCLTMVMFPSEVALQIVQNKLSDSFVTILVSSMLCNVLIYCAVESYKNKNILTVILSIATFIICGFNHSIANVCFVISSRIFTLQTFFLIILSVIGNSFGGIIFRRMSTYEGSKDRKTLHS